MIISKSWENRNTKKKNKYIYKNYYCYFTMLPASNLSVNLCKHFNLNLEHFKKCLVPKRQSIVYFLKYVSIKH